MSLADLEESYYCFTSTRGLGRFDTEAEDKQNVREDVDGDNEEEEGGDQDGGEGGLGNIL